MPTMPGALWSTAADCIGKAGLLGGLVGGGLPSLGWALRPRGRELPGLGMVRRLVEGPEGRVWVAWGRPRNLTGGIWKSFYNVICCQVWKTLPFPHPHFHLRDCCK